MYSILVDKSNNLITTEKEVIMHRSKLVNTLCFLVDSEYNGVDMSAFTVLLEYVSPVSHRYHTEILERAANYNEYLRYTLPVDTEITGEAGELSLSLSFVSVEMTNDGTVYTPVRKTAEASIMIHKATTWSDIIPDDALSAVDQRLIMVNAQLKAMEALQQQNSAEQVDDITYNKETGEIQLSADGKPIGNKIVVKDDCGIEDGIPAVDFSLPEMDADDEEDNIIEF